ncbi:uncharacterized protein K452DRAFT_265639 [Aplosporella prunicola CBS 121167]|uniref:Endoplasmic reticulum junction formation protein lunapark n=1 Tax=Aplosporella prunicola CBS 121167 TaxID=1176127 RepID=A0A6A6BMY9_9PEZI|nr:uncharacterized protein K452DRAFT_265639 [Aplosporella prunicola CBS 121167]KAF2145048.1 hypothetical protein K452DRAFT_265639 [Aplosporella prunicola CBS 121167]
MVSLWPWKDDTSAAGFEKALSALSTKIARTSATNDGLRQRSRRVKVMWTLYTGFAYILAALILVLVTGWPQWGPVEYTVIAGGPVIIYGVRTGLASYYSYRIQNTQTYLDNLYKQRDATIDKLKEATKYNSTQELLQKYGSPRPSPQKAPSSASKRKTSGAAKQQAEGAPQGRTNFAPPPTANIARNQLAPGTPPPPRPMSAGDVATGPFPPPPPQDQPGFPPQPPQLSQLQLEPQPSADFAPNAFASQYAAGAQQSNWYDRILDVLLGEDETQPKNRLALICSHCRLVNGQAPPGVKSLEEVGQWKCMGCQELNGQESEAQKLVEQVKESQKAWLYPVSGSAADGRPTTATTDGGMTEVSEISRDEREAGEPVEEGAAEGEDSPPSHSTRSRTKGKN